jgi:hypothetical protein
LPQYLSADIHVVVVLNWAVTAVLVACGFLGTQTGQLHEFDAGGTDGMRPFEGTFGIGDATCNFVQKV